MPWFVAIVAKSGMAFFTDAVGHDMLAKVAGGQEAHGAPPGYYLLLFFLTFWPGAVLAAPAVPMVWRARREPGAQFLLAWLVPSWIVFEVAMTKLPHYVLPLYPAIAILIAGILEGGGLSKARWLVRGTVGWFVFPSLSPSRWSAASCSGDRDLGLIAWPSAAAAVVVGLFAWWLYGVDGPERSLLRGMLAVRAGRLHDLRRCVSGVAGAVPKRADRRRDPRYRLRGRRRWRRPAITRSRAWCSCSAPRRALPAGRARPNSCTGAPAISR